MPKEKATTRKAAKGSKDVKRKKGTCPPTSLPPIPPHR